MGGTKMFAAQNLVKEPAKEAASTGASTSAGYAAIHKTPHLQEQGISQPALSPGELFEIARHRQEMYKVADQAYSDPPQVSPQPQAVQHQGAVSQPSKQQVPLQANQEEKTQQQTLEQSMRHVASVLHEKRNLLDPTVRLELHVRLSRFEKIKETFRSSITSLPLVGGFLESCFQIADKVIARVQEILHRVDELQRELLMERQAKEIVAHFTAEKRADALFHLAAIQHELGDDDAPLLLVTSTPDENAKKAAEAARRLIEDILQEYERLELEKKKHEAEEDQKREVGETLEQRIAKVIPGAGHDPRIAQLISAEISGIFQDYTDFDIRLMVEQILRVLQEDAKKLEEVC